MTPIRILMQTTIPPSEDDWTIDRFSLLRDYLASLADETGKPLYEVTARNRESNSDDPILSNLDHSDFDELWLFAVDIGGGLTEKECQAIAEFRRQGKGLLIARDHQDLGSSICNLDGVGIANYFHTRNPDPDESRRCNDDPYTTYISWPNYHSGSNGDYQKITPTEPIHELLHNPASPSGVVEFFPAHPHEGGVGLASNLENARVIATGTSKVTGRPFNLAVVFDRTQNDNGKILGRAVTESTFHHFCDYNWDVDMGCPSFVDEPPGEGMKLEPRALADIKTYVRNIAAWLAPIKK
ncbi:hypothetical protein Glo7428_0089 [Gloeocapsa sp. PCC 7428]|uniref:hypothetical protein n=1 Tax=Gloeocapsa sp. PCC 7428 TaxID=1173026 RepID=UPI0002A61ABB|nr:hypothetical protein [Gloeocapsa sp. PCC 7428]AFZ28706.1 hypothetical protein Glo7428_0089 [Gloeocapsa sp. PCC 7428]